MGVAKPASEYAGQMLAPDAWPELDEDNYYDRAQQYTDVLRRVTEVLETCQHEQSDLFDGGFWSGGAAAAANTELGTNIDELTKLQNGLATVITWHRYVADSITQAKWDVSDIVEAAQAEIDALENDSALEAAERTAAINAVVGTAYGANLGVVTGTAERILASKAWKPPHNALQDLLDQKQPPPVALPDKPAPPEEEERPQPDPAQPAPVAPPPSAPPLSPPGSPGGGAPPPTGMPPLTGQPPTPPTGAPRPPAPVTPGGPGGIPGGGPGAPSGPAAPLSPAASAEPLGAAGGRGKGMTPASLMSPSAAPRTEESTAAAPAGATGMPAGPMGASGGGSRGGRAGAYSAAAAPKSTGGTAPTKPAAAGGRAGARPSAHAGDPTSSIDHADAADAVVVTPIIPVSKARAERDAIADAATADAARRDGGSDPLRLARRIAAALNAPGTRGGSDLGFFWVTAVTTDGSIVVANSYGIAYIPDGIQLPEPVQLASADDAIPAADRARWVTYPVLAVQGWADHHDKKLRAVIATEQQLANSDPGAAKVVLKPDDIPDSGDMVGRSRLEVVDPEAADRLAATTDVRLVGMLPPAPAAGQQAPPDEQAAPEGAAPPADQRPMLWFDVMKPLASSSPGRQAAHLRAFQRYVEHTQDVVLNEAHTAVDPAAQRSAVADWLYWKHLSGLLTAALSDAR
ncbi:hypothetical protein [Mycobacterium sp. E2989]|uniref:hypothetical protein n=1 Tax=Mycobacterium sp. E2989 TaxID=1834140 RepID=UPI0008020600|nr:hypothetical protein [Mycobacterium sp. E2989]OBH83488.1 hypothetical protein A5680_11625 [Mycobacterium sp. E2989]